MIGEQAAFKIRQVDHNARPGVRRLRNELPADRQVQDVDRIGRVIEV